MMNTQNQSTSKAPTHTIYLVEPKGSTNKLDWLKAGVAWYYSDKPGLHLSINKLGAAYLIQKGSDATLIVRRNKPQE